MDGRLKMVALAGAEEIGMNMTVYSYEQEGEVYSILVDCGVAFESLPGASVVMPDISILNEVDIKISAVVITHGHEDHIGAIPYLFDKLQAPIYATPFTCGLIRKKMDYAKKKNYKLSTVKEGETHKIGPFNITWINATHSIPDNTMLGISVGGIKVVHTGDWKDDPEPLLGKSTNFGALAKFSEGGVHALVSDSTNIHEDAEAVSELTVAESLKDLVVNSKGGKFILTCFASNVARIKGCLEAAASANRKVLILGASLNRSIDVAVSLGYVKDNLIITEEEANNLPSNEIMILSTGSQAEVNSALWKMANGMRSAGSSLERGDTLVFSARVIDGRQRDVRKVINKLVEKGVRIIHPWNAESHIHASGHPSQPDIEKLLRTVKPNYVVPVHSEAEHRISHIAFAKSKGYKAFNLRNGMFIEISKDGIQKCDSISPRKVVVDGARLVSESSDLFSKRKDLGESGVIMISVANRSRKMISMVSNFGVFDDSVDTRSKKTLSKHLKYEVDRLLGSFSSADFDKKDGTVRKKIIAYAKKYVWSSIRKNPIIGVQILV